MISSDPLVSVICLCYNHERFIEESIRSVFSQTYKNIEVILIDDASTDQSTHTIATLLQEFPTIKFISNTDNKGNCKNFNNALRLSTGVYLVDFSTDDIMLPDRIEKQLNAFACLDNKYGIIFTDAIIIDELSREIGSHYGASMFKGFNPPVGEVYGQLLKRYFINPPTMMFRREVIEKLGGYDESLAYEDFDFWVRSSRDYHYFYLPEKLTKRRIVKGSLSDKFNHPLQNSMLESTYRVCEKALWLNRTESENKALAKRINYEMTQAFLKRQKGLVKKYFTLLKNMNIISARAYLLRILAGL